MAKSKSFLTLEPTTEGGGILVVEVSGDGRRKALVGPVFSREVAEETLREMRESRKSGWEKLIEFLFG